MGSAEISGMSWCGRGGLDTPNGGGKLALPAGFLLDLLPPAAERLWPWPETGWLVKLSEVHQGWSRQETAFLKYISY